MILGLNYYTNQNCSYGEHPVWSSYHKLKISNGIYDTLSLENEYTPSYANNVLLPESLPEAFRYSSILFAAYNNTIKAGNIEYRLGETNYFKLKRRIKDTYAWTTLSVRKLQTEEIVNNRFIFHFTDITNRSGKTYEYCVVPVTQDVESDTYTISEIFSSFPGIVIADKNTIYQTELETRVEVKRQGNSTHITTLGRKYPYLCSMGSNNYDSGTFQGMFVPASDSSYANIDFEHAWEYRLGLMELLNSGRPLLLKHYDGRAWIIGIEGEISCDDSEHHDKVITSASWKEIGDINSYDDMVASGLADAIW